MGRRLFPAILLTVLLVLAIDAGMFFALNIAGHDLLSARLGALLVAVLAAIGISYRLAQRLRLEGNVLMLRASLDPLSGLPNRDIFERRVAEAISACHRRGEQLALLFLDADGFKQVNDTHGHAAGDEVIRSIAERLPPLLRAGDMAARIGGDEFAVLVHAIDDASDAARVAARIHAAMAEPVVLNGTPIAPSLSIGIALYPRDGDTPDQLIASADRDMYAAKARGVAAG
jgi:diguanylate cyclase (GGDEF)-like protein